MNDDDILKNFSNYLMDLGFLNYSTYIEFSKKYDEISQRKLLASHIPMTDSTQAEIDKKNITDTLVEFYNSLHNERKKLLAINVFDRYIKRSEKKSVKETENDEIQLSNLDDIIMENNNNDNENNKLDTNKQIEHVESFNIPGIKNNKAQKEEKNDGCSFSNFIQSKKNRNKSNKNNFSYQRPKKTEENEKKIELNEHCTFQPNADKAKNKLSKDEQKTLIERLYKRNDLEKKIKLIEDIRSQQDKENIFQPNFKKGRSNLSRKNFEERLKRFEEVRLEQKENRKKEEEKQFKEKFPFAPKRKNSTSRRNNSMPRNNNIYQKLYEDNARKKERQNQNLKQIMNEIKDRANHPITTHNNIDYIKRMKYERYARFRMYPNSNSSKYKVHSMNNINININGMKNKEVKKSYELNRIEELYKEYKKIKEEMNLRKKPENNYNELYNIDGNEIDGEENDYSNNIDDDDKSFNYDKIDNNNSKEANFDNNNIEMNDDDDDDENNSKEENIDDNNKSENNNNNSIEKNNEDNNNSKEHNIEDNYEEGEHENSKDNENSINQNVDYADKASVEDENENEN